MTIDDRMRQLVRDAIEPMLSAHLNALEERLAERLDRAVQPPPSDAAPRLLTKKDVATQLRIDPRTLQRMVDAGEFPAPVPISPGRTRWRQATIDEWIDGRGS